jgi:hypothetical protein
VTESEHWYKPGEVRPRELAMLPRCPDCTSPDPSGRPPMFHPAHRWGPCWVKLPDGELCPHGVSCLVTSSPPQFSDIVAGRPPLPVA